MMAACASDPLAELSTKYDAAEILATVRLGELLRNSGELTKILTKYTPEQVISHLSFCSAVQTPRFQHLAKMVEGYTDEQIEMAFLLVDRAGLDQDTLNQVIILLRKCGSKAILSAIKLRDQEREYQKKYRMENHEKVNLCSAKCMKAHREREKKQKEGSCS